MKSKISTSAVAQQPRLRIAFLGLFGGTNLGNEATLNAVLANLREKLSDVEIHCISPKGSPVRELHGAELIDLDPMPISRFLWRIRQPVLRSYLYRALQVLSEPLRRRRARAHLRNIDLLVVPGTGIADDFGQGPLDLPLHLYRWSSTARQVGVPTYFVSIGAGPVNHWLSRLLIRKALAFANYRSYRDLASRTFACELGLEIAKDSIMPDLAFSLPRRDATADKPAHWPPRVIGLGVMAYHGWNESEQTGQEIYEAYIDKTRQFCRWLTEHGYSVRLLIGDTRADARPCEDLLLWAQSELSSRDAAAVEYFPAHSVDDLLAQISATDLVIAPRFHNVLLALLLGRPTISISYAEKNDHLMQSLDLRSDCCDIGQFSVPLLISMFTKLAAERDPTMPAARARMNAFRGELDRQYEALFRLIPSRP